MYVATPTSQSFDNKYLQAVSRDKENVANKKVVNTLVEAVIGGVMTFGRLFLTLFFTWKLIVKLFSLELTVSDIVSDMLILQVDCYFTAVATHAIYQSVVMYKQQCV